MPIDLTAPVASAPADRLTLQTSVVRGADAFPSVAGGCGCACPCFADDVTPSFGVACPPVCFADEA